MASTTSSHSTWRMSLTCTVPVLPLDAVLPTCFLQRSTSASRESQGLSGAQRTDAEQRTLVHALLLAIADTLLHAPGSASTPGGKREAHLHEGAQHEHVWIAASTPRPDRDSDCAGHTQLDAVMAPYDVLLTASAAGEASVGLQSTGGM